MEEKSLLQRIVAQTEMQVAQAIEEAIENGADVKRLYGNSAYIDGLFVQKSIDKRQCDAVVMLKLKSEKIKIALMDDADTLAMRKESLIRQIAEIDKQLILIKQ